MGASHKNIKNSILAHVSLPPIRNVKFKRRSGTHFAVQPFVFSHEYLQPFNIITKLKEKKKPTTFSCNKTNVATIRKDKVRLENLKCYKCYLRYIYKLFDRR